MIAYITWTDAASVDEWTLKEDIENSCNKIETVGFVIKEDEKVITVALNHDLDAGAFSCFMSIPKSCILYRAEMRVSKWEPIKNNPGQ